VLSCVNLNPGTDAALFQGIPPDVYTTFRTLKMGGYWVALFRSVKERDNYVPFIAKAVHMLCKRHQDAEVGLSKTVKT
jgi:hypothetical protein